MNHSAEYRHWDVDAAAWLERGAFDLTWDDMQVRLAR